MSKIRWLLAALGVTLVSLVPVLGASAPAGADPGTTLKVTTMTPVTGPYTGTANPVRGVPGGGLPWIITAGHRADRVSGADVGPGDRRHRGELENRARVGASRGGCPQHRHQANQGHAQRGQQPPDLGHLLPPVAETWAALRGPRRPAHLPFHTSRRRARFSVSGATPGARARERHADFMTLMWFDSLGGRKAAHRRGLQSCTRAGAATGGARGLRPALGALRGIRLPGTPL